jgi:hypothetical protein
MRKLPQTLIFLVGSTALAMVFVYLFINPPLSHGVSMNPVNTNQPSNQPQSGSYY